MEKKNKTVKSWVNRHISDHYVKMAQRDGYRSRASYKLIELDDKFKLLNNVRTVVDLGCAPGSWSQVCSKKIIDKSARIIGIDLLPVEPIHKVSVIQGDFTDNEVLDQLLLQLDNQQIDLILSDMSPNISGIKVVDQAKMSYLIELVLELAKSNLKEGGNCLIKVFHGNEFNSVLGQMRLIFKQIVTYKPSASRGESSEVYLLGLTKLAQ